MHKNHQHFLLEVLINDRALEVTAWEYKQACLKWSNNCVCAFDLFSIKSGFVLYFWEFFQTLDKRQMPWKQDEKKVLWTIIYYRCSAPNKISNEKRKHWWKKLLVIAYISFCSATQQLNALFYFNFVTQRSLDHLRLIVLHIILWKIKTYHDYYKHKCNHISNTNRIFAYISFRSTDFDKSMFYHGITFDRFTRSWLWL